MIALLQTSLKAFVEAARQAEGTESTFAVSSEACNHIHVSKLLAALVYQKVFFTRHYSLA